MSIQVDYTDVHLQYFMEEQEEGFRGWGWCGLDNDSGGEGQTSYHG